LKRPSSAKTPIVINFELWNECNESCVFCRSSDDDIYDANPQGSGKPIAKGKMDFDFYKTVLDSTANRLMMAIPYINGEPLLSKDIYAAIQYATDRRIGTLIASNGVLLNARNSRKLLEAGLDCLKVHISGFSEPVHSIEHRRGSVEHIKENLVQFMRLRSEVGAKTIVVLDYILYQHNKHELEAARIFAYDLGLVFNIRPGNPKGMEDSELPQSSAPLPTDKACDWLWTILSIDWDGAIYPCCDHVVWSNAERHGTVGVDDIVAAWNGIRARNMRSIHAKQGRTPLPICAQCPRQGLKFKW
jgi:MoaA/NifB/PqqE/SkfB family radical SAM enzyme